VNHLLRGIVPISDTAWARIDEEAKQRLVPQLGARRVADFHGPAGWEHSSVSLGRTQLVDGPIGTDGSTVVARRRTVLPLIEVRVPFTVARAELDDAERGARDLQFDDLQRTARELAQLENRAVFHGWPAAGIEGIVAASPHESLTLGTDADRYPGVIAHAVARLRLAGVEGPYALAIGPTGYTRIMQATEDTGHLLLDHLTQILGGTVVWTPGLDDATVLSQRGDDFHLNLGQDLSVGYSHHDTDIVHLYLEESFTFQVTEPDAAITLS
jgi:uncharacterized linocin/CFP29 family protein